MTKRFQSRKHLEFVGSKPCCICGSQYSIQVHHLLKPWNGYRGVSMRSNDKNVIPICFHHHNMLHKRGNEEAFFEENGFTNYHGMSTARVLWYESPAYDNHQQALEEHEFGWAEQRLKEEGHDG